MDLGGYVFSLLLYRYMNIFIIKAFYFLVFGFCFGTLEVLEVKLETAPPPQALTVLIDKKKSL